MLPSVHPSSTTAPHRAPTPDSQQQADMPQQSKTLVHDYANRTVDHGPEIASLRSAVAQLQRTVSATAAPPSYYPGGSTPMATIAPPLYHGAPTAIPVLPPIAPQVLLVTPRSGFGSPPPSQSGPSSAAVASQGYLLNEISSMRSHLANLRQQVDLVRERKLSHRRRRHSQALRQSPTAKQLTPHTPSVVAAAVPVCGCCHAHHHPPHHCPQCCAAGPNGSSSSPAPPAAPAPFVTPFGSGSSGVGMGSPLPPLGGIINALVPNNSVANPTSAVVKALAGLDRSPSASGSDVFASGPAAPAGWPYVVQPGGEASRGPEGAPYTAEISGMRRVLQRYDEADLLASSSPVRVAAAGGGTCSPNPDPTLLHEVSALHTSLDRQHRDILHQQEQLLQEQEDELMRALQGQQLQHLTAEQLRLQQDAERQREQLEAEMARRQLEMHNYRQQLEAEFERRQLEADRQRQEIEARHLRDAMEAQRCHYEKLLEQQREATEQALQQQEAADHAKAQQLAVEMALAQPQAGLAMMQQYGDNQSNAQQLAEADRLAREQAAAGAANFTPAVVPLSSLNPMLSSFMVGPPKEKKSKKKKRRPGSGSDSGSSSSSSGATTHRRHGHRGSLRRATSSNDPRSYEAQIDRLKSSIDEIEREHQAEMQRTDDREKAITAAYRRQLRELKEKSKKEREDLLKEIDERGKSKEKSRRRRRSRSDGESDSESDHHRSPSGPPLLLMAGGYPPPFAAGPGVSQPWGGMGGPPAFLSPYNSGRGDPAAASGASGYSPKYHGGMYLQPPGAAYPSPPPGGLYQPSVGSVAPTDTATYPNPYGSGTNPYAGGGPSTTASPVPPTSSRQPVSARPAGPPQPNIEGLEADPLLPPLNGRRTPGFGMDELEKRVDHLAKDARDTVQQSTEAGTDAARDVSVRMPLQPSGRLVEDMSNRLDHQQRELANLARDINALSTAAARGEEIDVLAPGGPFDQLQAFRDQLVNNKKQLEDAMEQAHEQLIATRQRAQQDLEKLRQRVGSLDREFDQTVEDRVRVADALAKAVAVVNGDSEMLKKHDEGPVDKEVEKRHKHHQDLLRQENERLAAVDKKLRDIDRQRNTCRENMAAAVEVTGRDLSRAEEKLHKAAEAGVKKVKELSDQLRKLNNAQLTAEKVATENAKKQREKEKRKKDRDKEREQHKKNKERSHAAKVAALNALGVPAPGQIQAPPPQPASANPYPFYGPPPQQPVRASSPQQQQPRYPPPPQQQQDGLLRHSSAFTPSGSEVQYEQPPSFYPENYSTTSGPPELTSSGFLPYQDQSPLGQADMVKVHHGGPPFDRGGKNPRHGPNILPISSSSGHQFPAPPGTYGGPSALQSLDPPSEAERMLQDDLDRVRKQHEEDVDNLRKALDDERQKRATALQTLRDEEFAPAMAKLTAASDEEIASLARQLKAERERHQREMDELKRELDREKAKRDAADRALRDDRNAKDLTSGRDSKLIDDLQDQLRKERERHQREMDELKRLLEEERAKKVAAEEAAKAAAAQRRSGGSGDGASSGLLGHSGGKGGGSGNGGKRGSGSGSGSSAGGSGGSGNGGAGSRANSAEMKKLKQQLDEEKRRHEDELRRLRDQMAKEKAERKAAIEQLKQQQQAPPATKEESKKRNSDEIEKLKRMLEEEQRQHHLDLDKLKGELERSKRAADAARRASLSSFRKDPEAEAKAKEAAEKLEKMRRQHQLDLLRQKEQRREDFLAQQDKYEKALGDLQTLLEAEKGKDKFDSAQRQKEKDKLARELDIKEEELRKQKEMLERTESMLRSSSPRKSRSTSLSPGTSMPNSPYMAPVTKSRHKRTGSLSAAPSTTPSRMSMSNLELSNDPFHSHRSHSRGSRVPAKIYTMVQGGEWLKEKYKEEPVYAMPIKTEPSELGSMELLTPSRRRRGRSINTSEPLFSGRRESRRGPGDSATSGGVSPTKSLQGEIVSPFRHRDGSTVMANGSARSVSPFLPRKNEDSPLPNGSTHVPV